MLTPWKESYDQPRQLIKRQRHYFVNKGLSSQGSEKAMAPHSSTLAWKIPWMEEPGRLQSMGSLRVGHDGSDLAVAVAVKAMVFLVVMYGCESWTVKKAERRRIDAFELWYWRRLLRFP